MNGETEKYFGELSSEARFELGHSEEYEAPGIANSNVCSSIRFPSSLLLSHKLRSVVLFGATGEFRTHKTVTCSIFFELMGSLSYAWQKRYASLALSTQFKPALSLSDYWTRIRAGSEDDPQARAWWGVTTDSCSCSIDIIFMALLRAR